MAQKNSQLVWIGLTMLWLMFMIINFDLRRYFDALLSSYMLYFCFSSLSCLKDIDTLMTENNKLYNYCKVLVYNLIEKEDN